MMGSDTFKPAFVNDEWWTWQKDSEWISTGYSGVWYVYKLMYKKHCFFSKSEYIEYIWK